MPADSHFAWLAIANIARRPKARLAGQVPAGIDAANVGFGMPGEMLLSSALTWIVGRNVSRIALRRKHQIFEGSGNAQGFGS
jgi:hypothetical protein